jgi:hypothetical protein
MKPPKSSPVRSSERFKRWGLMDTLPGPATRLTVTANRYPNFGTEQSIMDYGQAITPTSC